MIPPHTHTVNGHNLQSVSKKEATQCFCYDFQSCEYFFTKFGT